jgi:predicted nucleic acid-binding protein
VTVALDSWAVLRLLEGTDPAATRVQRLLDRAQPVMSWINLGEAFYVVAGDQGLGEAERVIRDLRPLLRLDLPSERRVLEAARIKAAYPLAYADAFAAATAVAHDAALLTGDPELLVDDAPWAWEDLRAG